MKYDRQYSMLYNLDHVSGLSYYEYKYEIFITKKKTQRNIEVHMDKNTVIAWWWHR